MFRAKLYYSNTCAQNYTYHLIYVLPNDANNYYDYAIIYEVISVYDVISIILYGEPKNGGGK